MGMLATFFALIGLVYICTRTVGEKIASVTYTDYDKESKRICDMMRPAPYIIERCEETLSNPDELFSLLEKELNYIFGPKYREKFDFHNEDHREAAIQLLLSQSKRGNKVKTTYTYVTDRPVRCGLPIKWNEYKASNGNKKELAKKHFWCDVYQCVEWNLREKYPDLRFVWEADYWYEKRTNEYKYDWHCSVLTPISDPKAPTYRFWKV